MKPTNKSKIISRFWTGNTTVNEETSLKQINFEELSAEEAYFNFINAQKKVPNGIEDDILSAINRRKQRRFITHWSTAAAIVLLASISGVIGYSHRQKIQAEQFALIEQTLNHVSTELTTAPSAKVVYANEHLVIVSEKY